MDCLGEDAVLRLLQHQLSADEAAEVHEHLARCSACRRLVAEATELYFDGPEPAAPAEGPPAGFAALPDGEEPAPLAEGTRVSRYVVRRLLGAGTGGAVYEADDPQLGRLVALKILRGDAGPRQQAEARALARLSHPNVVNVHDAGTFEGRAFIVMELVAGTSLDRWLAERPRTFREVLPLFVDAGRGLSAAHAAGLVHRDFKPENVIVGADGRARVADFGLARSSGAATGAPAGALAASTIAGTPAFMAPEQFLGRPADARSDQFGFCVALYQALYRKHPFGADGGRSSFRALARAVTAGAVIPPPASPDVPASIAPIVLRGLAAAPEERHASLEALVSALARHLDPPPAPGPAPAADRPRRTLAGAVAGALALSGVLAALALSRGQRSAAAAACGNAVVEPGEDCDDGNDRADDGCLPSCRWNRCGDGVVRAHVEDCDDGNDDDQDGCTTGCLRCPPGATRFASDGRCYERFDTPRPWAEAVAACRAWGGHLVAFNVHRELRAVTARLLDGRDGTYWIGLADRSSTGEYGWVTAEPGNPLLRWTDTPPAAGACVAQEARRSVDGPLLPWTPRPCETPLGYVCERSGWVASPRTNHAYRRLGEELIWRDAHAACAGAGGHLVTITDADENAFVGAQFPGVVWLGAIQRRGDQSFRWTTGEPFEFQDFPPGEPDRRAVPNCVVLGVDRRWHDRPCNGQQAGPYGVVCEID